MKKPIHGPSLYYATDKNIFDALNEHKVDTETVVDLFERRNTLVSKKTSRQRLAEYFSRLNHDYYDHKEISSRLGVVPRRERLTSMDIVGLIEADALKLAINEVAKDLEDSGDVTKLVKLGSNYVLHIQYSKVDYRRSEFNQVQIRDGHIEFQPTQDGYIVRNTQNDYLDSIRDAIVQRIDISTPGNITKNVVSLFGFPDPKVRSNFFYDLFNGLDGYTLQDVTDIYVFKPGSSNYEDEAVDVDTHVERVALKGTGVSRSEFLSDLAKDGYYTVKVGWQAREILGAGHVFDIEAVFANTAECTGFSFILVGVHQNDSGWPSKQRRSPLKDEVAAISRAIEMRSRELMSALLSGSSAPAQSGD